MSIRRQLVDVAYTHVAALEDPVAFPVLIDLVPVSQTDENASCDILQCMNNLYKVRNSGRNRHTLQFQKSIASRTTTRTVYRRVRMQKGFHRAQRYTHRYDKVFGEEATQQVYRYGCYSEEIEEEEGDRMC